MDSTLASLERPSLQVRRQNDLGMDTLQTVVHGHRKGTNTCWQLNPHVAASYLQLMRKLVVALLHPAAAEDKPRILGHGSKMLDDPCMRVVVNADLNLMDYLVQRKGCGVLQVTLAPFPCPRVRKVGAGEEVSLYPSISWGDLIRSVVAKRLHKVTHVLVKGREVDQRCSFLVSLSCWEIDFALRLQALLLVCLQKSRHLDPLLLPSSV